MRGVQYGYSLVAPGEPLSVNIPPMLIVKLRGMGWTHEKIAEAVGVGSGTIWRDIDSPAFPNGKAEIPPTVLGKDGKRYPTKYKKRKKKDTFVPDTSTHHFV